MKNRNSSDKLKKLINFNIVHTISLYFAGFFIFTCTMLSGASQTILRVFPVKYCPGGIMTTLHRIFFWWYVVCSPSDDMA